MEIRYCESIKEHTSFKIGGKISEMVFPVDRNDFTLLGNIIGTRPYYIMSNGTNLLFNDIFFDGVIINMSQYSGHIFDPSGNKMTIKAGTENKNIIKECLKHNIVSLSFLSGLPGRIGGALFMNAGAFGCSIAEYVKKVEVYDLKNSTFIEYQGNDLDFYYRGQNFIKEQHIIISCILEIEYGKNPEEAVKMIKKNRKYRSQNHPPGPSAGSVFKNPAQCPAGKIIEILGLKGKKKGGAQVSEKHGNFIINTANAAFEDVIFLINMIKKTASMAMNINLETEIRIISSIKDFHRL